ncbi:MAG: isocitrate lyase/phosphoenolpyruvate mutase family protein [Pseudomonadota bacterium]
MSAAAEFAAFAALHVAGDPLVLYNVWDAGSAQAAERAGAAAVASGSWSVAVANGYRDGHDMPVAAMLAAAARIVGATSLPVSIDFEGGYATDPAGTAANVAKLAAIGAVGCNFEDQVVGGEGLHATADQAARIAAIRAAVGPEFFINARTDLFLKAPAEQHDAALVEAAVVRATAYADAGASGFFAPGLADPALVARLTQAVALPLNLMAFPGAPDRAAWAAAGVARISHGPFPYRAALAGFEAGLQAALR